MFSYRHAFHAGNHADVLKHTALIAALLHLRQKAAALTVIDTHAGAGLYQLDRGHALVSGEAQGGVLRLFSALKAPCVGVERPLVAMKPLATGSPAPAPAPAVRDYLELVAAFNLGRPEGAPVVYPGSPFILQRLLRGHDRLKLFELHPSDARVLAGNLAQLDAGRQVALLREDGFEGLKRFLPPPSRRALVLCDPSYELKTDYARVPVMLADALRRFATGTYALWYPIIPRPEAHDLPRRLKTLAVQAGRPWLNATLSVKSGKAASSAAAARLADQGGRGQRPGLPASGMFFINPPHTLQPALREALPQLRNWLGQGRHAAHSLEAGQ